MKKKVVTVLIALFSLFALYYVFTNYNSSQKADAELLQLTDLYTNQTVNVDFAEKPTVLLLFTSWCPYCNDDAPKIVTLYEKYKEQLNIYGINLLYRDEISEVQKYADKYGIEYPILLDETGEVHRHFEETAFPALFFMNQEGQIEDYIIGSTDIQTIESSFQNLLARSIN